MEVGQQSVIMFLALLHKVSRIIKNYDLNTLYDVDECIHEFFKADKMITESSLIPELDEAYEKMKNCIQKVNEQDVETLKTDTML